MRDTRRDQRALRYGDVRFTPVPFASFAEEPAAPSRATWFLLGIASALLVPPILEVTRAGSKYAARRIEKKG